MYGGGSVGVRGGGVEEWKREKEEGSREEEEGRKVASSDGVAVLRESGGRVV